MPPCDLQCALMSLPYACGTKGAADVPTRTPYLRAEAADVATWRERLGSLAAAPERSLRVGLCWTSGTKAGLANRIIQARKSVPAALLAPLGQVAACSFIGLQTEHATDPAAMPAGLAVRDVSCSIGDFADTAALIMALDLVISVDTAVAHLAGALGRPVWLLNRFDADWRWCEAQADNPWYPTLCQFRQQQPGDWAGVLREVAAALNDLASARPGTRTPDAQC